MSIASTESCNDTANDDEISPITDTFQMGYITD